MSQWMIFSEEVKSIGGILITKTRELSQAPMLKDSAWRAFLSGWEANKSMGFLNGWGGKVASPELDETESGVWLENYKRLMEVLDSAGQVGITFLPSFRRVTEEQTDKKNSSWIWYYAFGFPTLTDKPKGRIIIRNRCSLDTLIAVENKAEQKLPPIARVYYRVMGEMIFTGDLSRKNGILGLDPGFLGYIGNPDENWLGNEDWVPWDDYQPFTCLAFLDDPDELWLGRNTDDQILLVSHDPGEVQEYANSLASLITDSLFYVDESRWMSANPHEARQQGYDAMRAGNHEKSVVLYRMSIEGFKANGENDALLGAKGDLVVALKNAEQYSEAKELASTVIDEIKKADKIEFVMQGPLQNVIRTSAEILLSEGKPQDVLEIIRQVIMRPELQINRRWDMTTWMLLALIDLGDKDSFINEWDKITNEIYEARKIPFSPSEPKFDTIIDKAKKLGWEIEFIPKK